MARADGISKVDLTGETYTVKQSLVRDRYRVYDESGELLLKADRRAFKERREIPFVDDDGNTVFRVEQGNVEDDYFVVPAESDRPLVILENDYSLLQEGWNVRNGRNERLVATIQARGPMVEFFRYYVPMMGVLPHSYTIEDDDGDRIGKLSGQMSLANAYELDISTADDHPQEPLVTAAITIDALDIE